MKTIDIYMRMRKTLIVALLSLVVTSVAAQENSSAESRVYLGVTGGLRLNHLRFSDLDGEEYSDRPWTTAAVFGVFVDYEFGSRRQYGIRPEIDYVRRGGRISDIDNELLGQGVTDQIYSVKANYLDFRLPLMYNFLGANSRLRPYVMVAPVLGIAVGGNIELKGVQADGDKASYKVDVSRANLASTYFALSFGAGLKYYIPMAGSNGYVGVEALYEHGLTDTYSSREKRGNSDVNLAIFPEDYEVNGSRKFNGFEFRITFAVPLSVFNTKEDEEPATVIVYEEPEPEIVTEPEPEPEVETVPEFEGTPCHTLDQIIALMQRGENVKGLVICSIDDVNFDFDKSEIRQESFEYLDKLAMTLIRMNSEVEVKGHTDDIGSDEVNERLSRDRAKAVVDYLVDKGVDSSKITYSYYGARRPIATNETVEGRRLNRRVEIEILQ